MMRSIDEILDEFKDINYAYNDCSKFDTLKRMLNDALEASEKRIANLETALAACIMRRGEQLPKEGKWISEYDGFEWSVRCSVCGEEALIKEGGSHDHAYSNFCPNCGAKMNGKEQNDEHDRIDRC